MVKVANTHTVRTFFFLFCLLSTYWSHAQAPANNASEFAEQYNWRIRQSQLNGVYIPKDLADAFVQLDRLIEPASRKQFVSVSEDVAFRQLFHSFGRWITLNWGFYAGSRYSHYLRQLNLTHPEDMAEFTVRMYHRHATQQPLDPKQVVEQIIARRKGAWRKRMLEGEVIQDTVLRQENKNG